MNKNIFTIFLLIGYVGHAFRYAQAGLLGLAIAMTLFAFAMIFLF